MMLSHLAPQVVLAAEEHHEKINHWIIGGLALLILLAVLAALVSFGGGREHT